MTLLRWLLARLAATAVTLFGAAVVVFIVIRVAPGDPIAMMLPPGATDADIQRLKTLYGLDKSILQQFFIWLGGVIHGDFGVSITARRPVLELVLGRLPATLELSFMALFLAIVIGGITALAASRWRGGKLEAAAGAVNGIALSTPDFLWGLFFILAFGVFFPILPISGRASPDVSGEFVTNFYLIESLIRLRFDLWRDLAAHMMMPALALALPLAAILSQMLKQSMKEALAMDYASVSRARGYGETHVVLREALPNALGPTLTLAGVQFTFLMGGTVIVERLFSYEGLGSMAVDAVVNRDLPLIQGVVILFALIFTMVNLAVDVLAMALNPRLRHG